MEMFASACLIGMALAYGLKEIAEAIRKRQITLVWDMERPISLTITKDSNDGHC